MMTVGGVYIAIICRGGGKMSLQLLLLLLCCSWDLQRFQHNNKAEVRVSRIIRLQG